MGYRKNWAVKVKLLSNHARSSILKYCTKLRGTGVSISRDFTAKQREEQAILRRHLRLRREHSTDKAFIRGNRLVVDGVVYTVDQLIGSEEREEGKQSTSVSIGVRSAPVRLLSREHIAIDLEDTREQASTSNIETLKQRLLLITDGSPGGVRTRSGSEGGKGQDDKGKKIAKENKQTNEQGKK